MSLITDLLVKLSGKEGNAALAPTAKAEVNHVADVPWRLANGTGAGQADLIFSGRRTVAGSGSDTLDLSGTLLNAFGATINMARLKMILIVAASGNANDISLGVPAANGLAGLFGAASQKIIIKPGGMFLIGTQDVAGYLVTDATADLIEVANEGGAAADYDVYLIGASA